MAEMSQERITHVSNLLDAFPDSSDILQECLQLVVNSVGESNEAEVTVNILLTAAIIEALLKIRDALDRLPVGQS